MLSEALVSPLALAFLVVLTDQHCKGIPFLNLRICQIAGLWNAWRESSVLLFLLRSQSSLLRFGELLGSSREGRLQVRIAASTRVR